MRRTPALLVFLALLVGTAPTADAQLGRLLNRARQAVSGTPALDAASPAATNGRPAPMVDYSRFLGMTYWPLRGQFYFGSPSDHIVFPPEGLDFSADDHGEYLIRTADGRTVARQALGSLASTGSAAFLTVGTRGEARWDGPLEAGDYVMDLVFRGAVAGRIPFSIRAVDGGDPFDPKTVYRRDGPWSTLAYFEHEIGREDYQLVFTAWVSAEDLGADNGRVTFTLSRNGEPVATSKEPLDPHAATQGDWAQVSTYLVTAATRTAINPTFFTIQDVTPGAYEMTVSNAATGAPIRSYAVTGGAGTLVPHARSAPDYEPRHAALSPRRMAGQSLRNAVALYWAEAE
jgi:hypothetical protein